MYIDVLWDIIKTVIEIVKNGLFIYLLVHKNQIIRMPFRNIK